jgi:hypothetical protein
VTRNVRFDDEATRRFAIDDRLMQIMGLVIAEWESDPMSVQCFDLRLVREARSLWKERQTCRLPFEL